MHLLISHNMVNKNNPENKILEFFSPFKNCVYAFLFLF